MTQSPRASFRLPREMLEAVDLLVKAGVYQDRSAFFVKATETLLALSAMKPKLMAKLEQELKEAIENIE